MNKHSGYVYGVGYFGEGKYKSRINGEKTSAYKLWFSMMNRCYSDIAINRPKGNSYKKVTICEEWHDFQNFAEWYDENYYEIPGEKMCLDKDILVKGNKIYSPNACVFVPRVINAMFIDSKNRREDCPIGVCWNKRDGIYESYCGIDGKQVYLGRSKDVHSAFYKYKNVKENHIEDVANRYKSKIPSKLYIALINYEVNFDD